MLLPWLSHAGPSRRAAIPRCRTEIEEAGHRAVPALVGTVFVLARRGAGGAQDGRRAGRDRDVVPSAPLCAPEARTRARGSARLGASPARFDCSRGGLSSAGCGGSARGAGSGRGCSASASAAGRSWRLLSAASAARGRPGRRLGPASVRRAAGRLDPLDLVADQLLDIGDGFRVVLGDEGEGPAGRARRGRCGRCGGHSRRDARARRN